MTFKASMLTCLFCFFAVLFTQAQQAGFSASPPSGCSPLAVSFTNTSTGFSSAATYLWTFGNGNSSTKENTGASYLDEGEYTVTLTVTDGSQSSSKSMTITVYKKPVVDFSVDITKGCAPLAVTFTSQSTAGDGTISTYTWDYGDGIAEKGESVQPHTYNISKVISPSLTVTNSHGCYSTLPKAQLIEVLPSVYAAFKPAQTVLCNIQTPLVVSNMTAGTGTLSYHWDFGDNSVSDQKQPQHTFSQPGSYAVKLSAESTDGCKSDTTITINAADYHTDFTASSLCQNSEALFEDKSTPIPTSETWLINGAPFSDTVPGQLHHLFEAPGAYQVQLNTLFETCPSTATKRVTILPSPSAAGFVAKLEGSCGSPVAVAFSDTTANANGWQWDFLGDGSAKDNKQQTSYTYTADGTYNVTLKRTNAEGCSVSVTQPVVVGKSEIKIESSEGDLGCETKQTIFSAISLENISQYHWDFGDGGTSTEATPQHTFTTTGTFTIYLDYVTQSGCAGRSKYVINIYEKPKFDFTAINGTNICGSTPVGFNVTGTNLIGTYFWNYGDSGKYVINNSMPYSHQYQNDSVFTVSLVIDNNGCTDTVTKQNYLTVIPPFPHISSVVNSCNSDRSLVTFSDTSNGAKSWSWDFGDNSAPTIYSAAKPQVQHTYLKSGHYIATLTTTNGACSAIDTANVYVLLKQQPQLTSAVTTFCGSDIFRTQVTNIDNNPHSEEGNLGYTITSALYGDGSIFGGNIYVPDSSISQNEFGVNFENTNPEQTRLRIITKSDYFGCADTTAYISFQALGPIAGFSLKENNVCFKTPVVFTDKSTPTHNSPIVKWNWQFGDSTSQVNILGTSVSHRYPEPGTFVATLTVTDAKGCSASIPTDDGFIIVKGPKAAFTVSANQVLPLSDLAFYNQTNTLNTNSSDNKYTWSFGDGNSIKNQDYQDSVIHSYAAESIDTVQLIATNAVEHCSDTASQVVYVKNPNLSFVYTTSFINPAGGCPPVIGSFTSTSKNTSRIAWNFGDGGGISGDGEAASHVYTTPGVYKVTLYGYFFDGTMDSVFELVTIKGPYASLSAVKPFACGAELITLKATSANSRNFTWDFGDGTVISNSDTFASHRYLTPNIYTPSLIVSDGSNCKFAYFPELPIIIDTLHLDINRESKITCDSSLTLFTPTTLSLAKDSLHLPITYHWDFGTGKSKDTAGVENTSFTYNTPGTYEIILSGASPYGCTDITRDTIVVQPTPKAFIAGTPEICENDSAIFTATATREVSWQWQFGNGNTSDRQNPPPQVYTKSGVDSVSLIVNDKGCYDTAWHRLLVNAKPDVNPSPLSAHLCQNDSVQLQAHDGTSYQWTPNIKITGANTATPYVHPDTATTYYVDVKNGVGCTSRDSISITVTPRFTVATPSPFYICPGGVVQLKASGADSYHWLDADILSDPDAANPTTSLYESRTYTVVGSDSYGCFTDTAAAQVLTGVIPTAEAGMDITTFAGTDVPLNATGSSDVVKWQWLPASYIACDTCPNTILTPHADLQYVLKVTNASGCSSFDSLHVTILCKAARITVPSAFTPNGDGRNDYFMVLGRGIKEVQQFAVFDRYGNLLFEQSHLVVTETGLTGWNGTYKNKPMPPGTYVYIANIVCDTGEIFPYKGTVVLIR